MYCYIINWGYSAVNIIRNLILKSNPDYDFNRYRFKPGDIVRTLDGAVIVVEYSALDYIKAFPIKRSISCKIRQFQRVHYNNLPYYEKDNFEPICIPITKSLCWKIGNIIVDEYGAKVLLFEEVEHQCFYGFVLETDNDYYLHTRIYVQNPYKDYIL